MTTKILEVYTLIMLHQEARFQLYLFPTIFLKIRHDKYHACSHIIISYVDEQIEKYVQNKESISALCLQFQNQKEVKLTISPVIMVLYISWLHRI